jgi:prepilin-type processing-associated H-X9-DG protein
MVATYLTCALGAALLGGYGTGRKRSKGLVTGVGLYVGVTVIVTALALTSMFVPLNQIGAIVKEYGSAKKYDPKADKSCTENLQSLYIAFNKYVEYNDSLPPAETWQDQDDFKGAIQKDEWLHCPEVSNRHDTKFGYAYNAALSGRRLGGKKLNEMPDAAKTPLLYDSTDLAKNAHDGLTSLPRPGRHGGKNNILFCDGHIESVPPK